MVIFSSNWWMTAPTWREISAYSPAAVSACYFSSVTV